MPHPWQPIKITPVYTNNGLVNALTCVCYYAAFLCDICCCLRHPNQNSSTCVLIIAGLNFVCLFIKGGDLQNVKVDFIHLLDDIKHICKFLAFKYDYFLQKKSLPFCHKNCQTSYFQFGGVVMLHH